MSSDQSNEVSLHVNNKSQPLRLEASMFCVNDATQNVLVIII
jgi:hypothetical protein